MTVAYTLYGDGVVNGADLNIVLSNYNQSVGASAAKAVFAKLGESLHLSVTDSAKMAWLYDV